VYVYVFRSVSCAINSIVQNHQIYEFEKSKPKSEEIAVSPDIGLILHVRRPVRFVHSDSENSIVTNVLAPFADRANERWQSIVSSHNLSHIKWNYFAIDVLQQMDDCFWDVYERGICAAFTRLCGDKLKTNNRTVWIHEPNTWTVL
jgi:hypothetical protein